MFRSNRRRRRARRRRKTEARRSKEIKKAIRKLQRIERTKLYPTKILSRIIHAKPSLLSKTIERTTDVRNRFDPKANRLKDHKNVKLEMCKEKERSADQARRRNFFKAKNKGATSIRPEHQRRHKRCQS